MAQKGHTAALSIYTVPLNVSLTVLVLVILLLSSLHHTWILEREREQ